MYLHCVSTCKSIAIIIAIALYLIYSVKAAQCSPESSRPTEDIDECEVDDVDSDDSSTYVSSCEEQSDDEDYTPSEVESDVEEAPSCGFEAK